MEKIRILLADDHQLIVNGISQIIKGESNFDLIETASNGEEALVKIQLKNPDIAILDIEMPKLSGIDLLEKIDLSKTKVIILSAYEESSMIRRCLQLGAKGYLFKRSNPEEIIDAIKRVNSGSIFISHDATEKILTEENGTNKKEGKPNKIDQLTKREMEILQLIVDGNSNSQIASLLFISKRTVDTHRVNLMKKLDVHSTVELVKFALMNNI